MYRVMEWQIRAYRSFEGACCLRLHDLTSRLPESEVEGTTILRNIGYCISFDVVSLPDRLGSSAAPLQAPHMGSAGSSRNRAQCSAGGFIATYEIPAAVNTGVPLRHPPQS